MKTGTGLFLISFRIVVTSSIFFIVSLAWVNAQNDTLPRGKALNFPFRKYGISIGNSSSFNGIRVNFRDKNVTNVNGFNATLWIKSYPNIYPVVKGISVGTWPTGRSLHGINVGVLGIVASEGNLDGISLVGGGLGAGKNINGIAIAGLGLGGERNINGLSLSGLFTLHYGDESSISGINISGLGTYSNKINGLSIGGFGVVSKNINGIVSSLAYISAQEKFRGISVTPGYLNASDYKGLAISGVGRTKSMTGLSIALFNKAEELHGVQLGLLNVVGNNRKIFKAIPIMNIHLKK